VAHLVERGLVATIDGPPRGACRRRRLLLVTNLGLAVLACRDGMDPRELARRRGLWRGSLDELIRQLPAVLSSYELLALLAGVLGKAQLQVWARPWRPRSTVSTTTARGMCLPAYAALKLRRINGQHLTGGYVLVADTGGLPPQALRSQFARLARLQLLTGTSAPVLAIATTSERRVKAWAAVLDSIAAAPNRGSLEGCIDTWDAWRRARIALPWNNDVQMATGQVQYRRGALGRSCTPMGKRTPADRCASSAS